MHRLLQSELPSRLLENTRTASNRKKPWIALVRMPANGETDQANAMVVPWLCFVSPEAIVVTFTFQMDIRVVGPVVRPM